MIHVATVHFLDDRWIDVQQEYLKRYINSDYKVYGFLTCIDNWREHEEKFHYVSAEWISEHPVKLNLLADMICMDSSDDSDIIVFIDGDAFPIAPIVPLIEAKLAEHKLIAVQRTDNNGDIQPHPCFCITTVGFWKKIKGNWHKGFKWENSLGQQVSDTGGEMLHKMEEYKIDWLPLKRTNKKNAHPLLFGVYGDVVYHHGAGFRAPVLRIDNPLVEPNREIAFLENILERLPDNYGGLKIKKSLHSGYRKLEKVKKRNQELIKEYYDKILDNQDFYKEFM